MLNDFERGEEELETYLTDSQVTETTNHFLSSRSYQHCISLWVHSDSATESEKGCRGNSPR